MRVILAVLLFQFCGCAFLQARAEKITNTDGRKLTYQEQPDFVWVSLFYLQEKEERESEGEFSEFILTPLLIDLINHSRVFVLLHDVRSDDHHARRRLTDELPLFQMHCTYLI